MKSLLVILFAMAACGGEFSDATDPTAAELDDNLAAPPQDLETFAKQVSLASASAQGRGSRSCGIATPRVFLGVGASVKSAVLNFVSQVVDVSTANISRTEQACGAGAGACANLFQNSVFHQDGIMGTALMPSAQRVDSEAQGIKLAIFTPKINGVSQPPAVVTAGLKNGWLMGVAYFSGRTKCVP